MPETVRGTLSWDGDKPRITYPTRRGTNTVPVPQGQLASNLKPQKDSVEVDLEIEAGRPVHIRSIGAAWTTVSAVPAAIAGRAISGTDRVTAPGPGVGTHHAATEKPAFHNPYGFLRAPTRRTNDAALGDHPGPSHARYSPERWTGQIRVCLTVGTPLLIPDTTRCTEQQNGHKSYPVRLTPDGHTPYLPPTSVKGMLRNAFEAVTNSRLPQFGHCRRLGLRMQAREGLAMVPGRVVGDQVELLMGTNAGPPSWSGRSWDVPDSLMYAAWLPRYQRAGGIAYPDNSLPQHEEGVEFWAERTKHRSGRFSYWQVKAIAPPRSNASETKGRWRNTQVRRVCLHHKPEH
jgi:hypothetical protein